MSNKSNKSTSIQWNVNALGKIRKNIADAQITLDFEVLRGCSPYVPFLTGKLAQSGLTATKIGSGKVEWRTPYARRRYYEGKMGSNGEPLRGPFWFERWKTANGQAVIDAIQKEFGGED